MGFKTTTNEDYICKKIKSIPKHNKVAIFGLKKCILKESNLSPYSKESIEMVQKLSNKYIIVVVTSYLNPKKDTTKPYIKKVIEKLEEYNVPMVFLCSLKHNRYELPLLGFWDLIRLKVETKRENCFYVGTRAGRLDDENNLDYKFALNCGIDFYTPTFMFNDIKCRYPIPKKITLPDDDICKKPPKIPNPKIVLVMGYPCSGKTTIVNKHFSKYNTDFNVSGTIIDNKFYDRLKKHAMKNETVIIEGSFLNRGLRNGLLEFAKAYRYNTQCIRTNVNYKLAKHLNVMRMLDGGKLIKNQNFKHYQQFYEEPTLDEGWDDVYLYTDKFQFNERQNKQFNLYLY